MRIDHVEICNFRNYEKAKLDFHEHINVCMVTMPRAKQIFWNLYL